MIERTPELAAVEDESRSLSRNLSAEARLVSRAAVTIPANRPSSTSRSSARRGEVVGDIDGRRLAFGEDLDLGDPGVAGADEVR